MASLMERTIEAVLDGLSRVTRCAGANGLENFLVIVKHRQHHDAGGGRKRFDLLDGVNAVESRQAHIQQNHVGNGTGMQGVQGVFRIGKLVAALHARHAVDHPRKSRAEILVVLDQPDAQRAVLCDHGPSVFFRLGDKFGFSQFRQLK